MLITAVREITLAFSLSAFIPVDLGASFFVLLTDGVLEKVV